MENFFLPFLPSLGKKVKLTTSHLLLSLRERKEMAFQGALAPNPTCVILFQLFGIDGFSGRPFNWTFCIYSLLSYFIWQVSIFIWKTIFSHSRNFKQLYDYFSFQPWPQKCQLKTEMPKPSSERLTIPRGNSDLDLDWSQRVGWTWDTSAAGSGRTDPPVTQVSPIIYPHPEAGKEGKPSSQQGSRHSFFPVGSQYVLLVSRWFCWRGLSGCALPRLDCPDSVGWPRLCWEPVVMGDWSLSLSQEDSLPPAKQGTTNHEWHGPLSRGILLG